MTDETKEERDVKEAWAALERCVVERSQHMGAAELDRAREAKRVYDAAIEARTLAKLRAGVVPLTMTAERETLVRSGNLWVGNVHAELLAELDATRAALAEARERAEQWEAWKNGVGQAYDGARKDLAAELVALTSAVAARDARIRELEAERDFERKAVDLRDALVQFRCEERDDACAKLAALVEAASMAAPHMGHKLSCLRNHAPHGCTCGVDDTKAAIAAALEAARGA